MEPDDSMDMGIEPDVDMNEAAPDMGTTPEDMSTVITLPEPDPEPETEETCASAPFDTPASPRNAFLWVLLAGLVGHLRRRQRSKKSGR
jgi:MYXO-CTERM domain-containing protein